MKTQREKDQAIARIEKATNEELGQIYLNTCGHDPFKRHALILPSVVRAKTIKALTHLINTDVIKFDKAE